MPKYAKEVQDKAVEAAKTGMSLKQIQLEIGPNPKATQRYLAKAGIDFKEMRAKLKAEGKIQPATKKQGKKAASTPKETVVEE